MSRKLLFVALLALAACGSETPSRPYEWNDLRLITSYTAKAVCSCLYVEERGEDECRAYGRQSPAVATWSTDAKAKTVEASAVLLWSAKARFVSERFGCVLE